MGMVSIQEMRFEFAKIKAALERGEELTLTYRNRPLARLIPVGGQEQVQEDSALRFGLEAEELDPVSNEEIDGLIYG
jgi:antitoxin (DNA-binding transcriptional repressor) of toxin-antitoxin stability system